MQAKPHSTPIILSSGKSRDLKVTKNVQTLKKLQQLCLWTFDLFLQHWNLIILISFDRNFSALSDNKFKYFKIFTWLFQSFLMAEVEVEKLANN